MNSIRLYNYKVKKKEIKSKEFDVVYLFIEPYDNIYFSLKTVEKFLNKVNNIYIINRDKELKKNKLSKWIEDKIKYINYTQIIDDKLNDINSIENYIWNIPNITDYALYLRKGTYIGNYIEEKMLFYNSVPLLFYDIGNVENSEAIKYFKKKFNYNPNIKRVNSFEVIIKKLSKRVYKLFNKEKIPLFGKIDFFDLTAYIGIYYGYYKICHRTDSIIQYFDVNNDKNDLNQLFSIKPNFFAIDVNSKCSNLLKIVEDNYLKDFNKKVKKLFHIFSLNNRCSNIDICNITKKKICCDGITTSMIYTVEIDSNKYILKISPLYINLFKENIIEDTEYKHYKNIKEKIKKGNIYQFFTKCYLITR